MYRKKMFVCFSLEKTRKVNQCQLFIVCVAARKGKQKKKLQGRLNIELKLFKKCQVFPTENIDKIYYVQTTTLFLEDAFVAFRLL